MHLNLKIGATKANLEKMSTQFNLTNSKLMKTQSEVDSMISRCDKLQIELNQQSNLLKLKENECALLAKENALGAKCRESLLKKVTSLEGARDELAKA